MRFAHRPSWRLSADVSHVAHLALLVRDAGRLPIPPDDGLPPPRTPATPEPAGSLTEIDRAAAASQWLDWWHAIVAAEGDRLLATPNDPPRRDSDDPRHIHDTARRHLAEQQALADPPSFATLADRPDLQALARAVYDLDDDEFDGARRAEFTRRPQLIEWHITHKAAQAVARERHLPINSLNAAVLVLFVEGVWWSTAAPGVVLASLGAVHDERVAARLVRAAYRSAR